MRSEKITNGSGVALCALAITTNAYSVLLGTDAGAGTWISHILASLAALVCVWCITYVCDAHPDKSFYGALEATCGKWSARILALFAAAQAALTCIVSMTVFSRFVQVTALPRTPQIILPLLIVLTAAFAVRRGSSAVAGAARLLVWFSAAVFLVFALLGMRWMDFSLLVPSRSGVSKLAEGAGEVFLNRFSVIPALAAIYPRMKSGKTRRSAFLTSVAVAGAVLTVISAVCVATLGEGTARSDFYPVFTAMSVRGIGGFVQHTELLACITMTQSLFFKCAVCLLFCDDMLSGVFGTSHRAGASVPIALIFAALTQIIYRDISALRGLVEWKSGAEVAAVLLFAFAPTLALISKIRQKQK